MARVAVVRRELPLRINIALRLGVALAGVMLAVVIMSSALGVDIYTVTSRVVEVFVRPDMLRYFIVFLPLGLGLAVAYSAKLWNLGAEGQLVVGGIVATFIALFTPLGSIDVLGPSLSLLCAAAAGALWALIPAVLRVYLGVNEALTTLMMNYIAYYLVDFLVYGPWRGRGVYGYPETDPIPSASKLPWLPGLSFSMVSLLIAVLLVPAVYYFLYKTRIGIAIRALGSNPNVVELSGIPSRKVALLAFVVSGAIAGLVGGNEILMYHRKLVPGEKIGAGMGFVAILVAWFADLNPLAMPLAAYYVSALHYLRMVVQMGELTEPVARLFIGVIFALFLVSVFVSRYRVVIRR